VLINHREIVSTESGPLSFGATASKISQNFGNADFDLFKESFYFIISSPTNLPIELQ
jgi:hypothetical protein